MKLWELKEESIGEISNRFQPKFMSDSEIMAWVKENASQYYESGTTIFRGTYEHMNGLLDTTKLKRRSANSYGYYNMWIDNHPNWKAFPKRSESIICATRETTSELFGEVHLVIPADNARIGVCPEADIWGSFPEALKIFKNIGSSDLADFEERIKLAISPEASTRIPDYATFVKLARATTPETLMKNDDDNELANFMNHAGYDDVEEMLEAFWVPDNGHLGGFKHFMARNFEIDRDQEVWVSGNVIQYQVEDMSAELHAFFKEKLEQYE